MLQRFPYRIHWVKLILWIACIVVVYVGYNVCQSIINSPERARAEVSIDDKTKIHALKLDAIDEIEGLIFLSDKLTSKGEACYLMDVFNDSVGSIAKQAKSLQDRYKGNTWVKGELNPIYKAIDKGEEVVGADGLDCNA